MSTPVGAAHPPLLQLHGVTKDYGTRVVTHVLRGIDLVVEPGEFLALTGPSGSGKTTLLNLIGLLDRPTAGRITFQGWDVATLDEGETTALRGRGIGFVFQFHYLLPAFTAQENVMLPLLADRGRRDEEMVGRARDLLGEVGLADRASFKATDLSGGQQQRVALARSLVMRPPLVLADEPTGNLDSESGEQVFQLLRDFNRRHHTAFVIVTHDDRLAERCDRIVHLVDGQVDSDRRRDAMR
ncbi:MAG TPA: ABC transporter ATP-binding protein [Gemmatimonadaceae bacterium]|nr:MAG: ABC transporter ATP-binding protein [Gemmatimonadetes bacterium SCN 70-22]HMN08327.1 ABC transporter ATP-binding protein [Gemmatimonadaceae bacterium]